MKPTHLLVLAAALLAALPLWFDPGFLSTRAGGDSPFLLFRLHQMHAALSDGVFPVRWMPDAAYGMGYPFFHFYGALPYYLAALLKFAGLSYVVSLKLAQTLGFLLAAFGAYGWAVRHVRGPHRKWAGVLAAAAYTFAPFHMVNVYVRGDSLSEFWAFAFYPLILLAIDRVVARPRARSAALLAFAYGGLLLTHNLSAFLFTPFAALYALVMWWGAAQRFRAAAAGIAGGVLALALAAWFWLPVIAESGLAQTETLATGYFHYANHFRDAGSLVQSAPLFDYGVYGADRTPFAMGWAQVFAALIGMVGLLMKFVYLMQQKGPHPPSPSPSWRRGENTQQGNKIPRPEGEGGVQRRVRANRIFSNTIYRRYFPEIAFIVIGLALSTLMITPLSAPLWEAVPLLPVAQFPWRFLSVQALFTALAAAYGAELFQRWPRFYAMAASVLFAATALGALPLHFIAISDADVTTERLQIYEHFTGNIGTTIRYEWLPAQVRPRPYVGPEMLPGGAQIKVLRGGASGERLEKRADSQKWAINAAKGGARIAFPLYFWPGWEATINGEPVQVDDVDGLGWIAFDVPEGAYEVTLALGRTPVRAVGEALSLAGLGAALAMLFWTREPVRMKGNARRWIGAGAGVGLLLAALNLWHEQPRTGDLMLEWTRDAFPHHTESAGDVQGFAPPAGWLHAGTDSLVIGDLDQEWVPPGLYYPVVKGGYLLPVAVTSAAEPISTDAALAFEGVELAAGGPGVVDVRMRWAAGKPLTRNLTLALRLFDAAGNLWAEHDAQMGLYGGYPTGFWRAGEIVRDWARMALDEGAPPSDSYRLNVIVYDSHTGETFLEGDRMGLAFAPVPWSAPAIEARETPVPWLGLGPVAMPASNPVGRALPVHVKWIALSAPEQSARARWELRRDGEAVWSSETDLAPGSDPALWAAGAYVVGRHSFEIPSTLEPDDYALWARFIDAKGDSITESALEIGHVRLMQAAHFEVPDLSVEVGADYGELIRLWGYDLARSADSVDLRLVWGALADTDVDYTFFVHLFDPATEAIPAQVDTMPHAYLHPTSDWLPGEVVEDRITLPLVDVPPGDYRLAVGWYAGDTRLPVEGDEGGRVILPDRITVR